MQNEIRLMAMLKHPNVIKMYELYRSKDELFIIMQLLTGGSLGNFLKLNKVLSERSVSKIMRKLLDGLAYLHSKKIIHRDLKPDNLVFKRKVTKTEKNEPIFDICIVDLGLA